MKTHILLSLFLASTALSQTLATLEEAQGAARILLQFTTVTTAVTGAPISIDADVDHPQLLKGEGDAGVLIIPQKTLTSDLLANVAENKPTPIAQLWLNKATLVRDGKPTSDDRTRRATISLGDKSFDLQVYLLGISKTAAGAIELLVFGRDSAPLLRIPLEKIATAHQMPAELSGQKTGEANATLTVSLLGQYKADVPLTKREQ
jgi:hypothetical protein